MSEAAADSRASMWGRIAAWLTPFILFVIINVTIGAIAVISILATQKQRHRTNQQSSSHDNILHRVTSFAFPFREDHPSECVGSSAGHTPTRTSSLLQRLASIRLQQTSAMDEAANRVSVDGSPGPEAKPVLRSDPAAGKKRRIGKSISFKLGGGGEEKAEDNDDINGRRPLTAREGKDASFGDDDGVDAKADHFINKFKHQLKLQRLDSILRSREMLHPPAAGN